MPQTNHARATQAAPDLTPVRDGHSPPAIPDYLKKVYWWAYLHPRGVRVFERQWLVNLILWGNFASLRDQALDELGKTIEGQTLQVACVYGDFTNQLVSRLAPGACLNVVDVAPIQLHNLRQKIGDRPQVDLACQNAAALDFEDASFDQVVVFFLLHELPEAVRAKAVQEIVRVTRPGGKIVFVDYHRPKRWWYPQRYLMPLILRTLEPFAMDLWNHEISLWLPSGLNGLKLEKSLYYGGLYQKLVITRQ